MGLVKYYRDMWEKLLHTLAPLIKITYCTVKFKWTKIEQYVFKETKRIVAHGVLFYYPYFNK